MNTETIKQYTLLKELPDGSKIGDLYQYMQGSDKVYINKSRPQKEKLTYKSVENNPDWFKEVLPSDVPVKERVSVNSIGVHDNFKGNGNGTHWYQFCSSKPCLTSNEINKVQLSIESALNNDVPVQNRFATLSQVMKIVDEWLNSEDVFILDKEAGNKLPDAWIECVSGSLLKRMALILPGKTVTSVVDDDADDMVSLRSYIKYLEEEIAINKEKGYSGEKLVGLLRDCLASTWGNTSLYKTQGFFDKFLHDRNLTTTDQQKKDVSISQKIGIELKDKAVLIRDNEALKSINEQLSANIDHLNKKTQDTEDIFLKEPINILLANALKVLDVDGLKTLTNSIASRCGLITYSQSQVDDMQKEVKLHYFREGYKYVRALNQNTTPFDENAEITVQYAFEKLLEREQSLNTNNKSMIVGEDMICPVTNKHCDDECCMPGSICNISSNDIKDCAPQKPTNTSDLVEYSDINTPEGRRQRNIPEPIEQPTTDTGKKWWQDILLWDKEMLVEFQESGMGLTDFRNSKKAIKPGKELIEIGAIIHSNPIAERAESRIRKFDYHFYSSKCIPKDRLTEISTAIEKTVNKDTRLIVKTDYDDLRERLKQSEQSNVDWKNKYYDLLKKTEQPTTDHGFVWTDKLVEEFYSKVYCTPSVNPQKDIEDFKQSKQPKQTANHAGAKMHTGVDVLVLKDFIENYVGKNTLIRLWHKCQVGHKPVDGDNCKMEWEISKGQFADCRVLYVKDIIAVGSPHLEAVNIVIEKPQDQLPLSAPIDNLEKAEWEVVAYNNHKLASEVNPGAIRQKEDDGLFYFTESPIRVPATESELKREPWEIHSVKRLVDNLVFSAYEDTMHGSIKSFEICGRHMMAKITEDTFVNIKDLKKRTGPGPAPFPDVTDNPILFTTEDRVELTDRLHEVYAIRKGYFELFDARFGKTLDTWLKGWYTYIQLRNPKENESIVLKLIKEHFLIFSTQEAAERYIIDNKPKFSIQMVLDKINGYVPDEIWQIVKEKLKL